MLAICITRQNRAEQLDQRRAFYHAPFMEPLAILIDFHLKIFFDGIRIFYALIWLGFRSICRHFGDSAPIFAIETYCNLLIMAKKQSFSQKMHLVNVFLTFF